MTFCIFLASALSTQRLGNVLYYTRHRRTKCRFAQHVCIAVNCADLECILVSRLKAGFGARTAIRNYCCLYISTYSAQNCSLRKQ